MMLVMLFVEMLCSHRCPVLMDSKDAASEVSQLIQKEEDFVTVTQEVVK